MAQVEFRDVSKVFERDVTALDHLSLTIEDGEFMVLVGPSGCGKSTALRLVAGLETLTAGTILADGKPLNELTPQERNVAVVFQNYALYPHKTVRQNLEFPLRMMKMPRRERQRKVAEAAELLGLQKLLDRRPKGLSGGQQQRVAMGRAIVREPIAFLMDEPLSNLDAKLRVEIRAQIAELQRRVGTTTLYVTHDQVEAMTLGERVGVLRDGRLQQVSSAQELYSRPANVFVATFIGSPRMNVFLARLEKTGDGELLLQSGAQRWRLPRDDRRRSQLASHVGRKVLCGLRPEAFEQVGEKQREAILEVTVRAMEALGHERIVYADCRLDTLSDEALARIAPDIEETAPEDAGENEARRQESAASENPPLVVRLPAGAALNRNDRLRLAADIGQVHLFDRQGHALGAG
jgi:multiple sugar transport system ATP-binding protein